jgi:general secretion pathway protein B
VSLILDALRRADADRERGAVPGLHAQPMPVPSLERSATAQMAPWHWIAVVAVAGLLAALGWMFATRVAPTPAGASGAAAVAPVPAPTKAPAQADAAANAAPSGAEAQPVTEPQPVAEPAPWTSPEPRKTASAAGAAATAPASVPASAPPAARSAPPAAPAEPEILRREQLPEDIRAQLPPLAVGGSIYSASAANRTLIIDGRIYRESDRLSPDLVLERIGVKSAVLQFKGRRFEIVY